MYRNLDPACLGVSGRQSEIIELALTYGFRGLEIDADDFLKRAAKQGVAQAARFINSGQLKIGGYELPVAWRGAEGAYRASLALFESSASVLAESGARVCHTAILPASDDHPYHENFELHRQRLGQMASILGNYGIKLGVQLFAAAERREGKTYQFIYDAEALVTLLKSITEKNLGLALDTWNWHFGGGTPKLLDSFGRDRVFSVSIADAPRGAVAAQITEKQRVLPRIDEQVVDNVGYLKMLREVDFSGPVTLATSPKALVGQTREGTFQSCHRAMDDLWNAVGLPKVGRPMPVSAGFDEEEQARFA